MAPYICETSDGKQTTLPDKKIAEQISRATGAKVSTWAVLRFRRQRQIKPANRWGGKRDGAGRKTAACRPDPAGDVALAMDHIHATMELSRDLEPYRLTSRGCLAMPSFRQVGNTLYEWSRQAAHYVSSDGRSASFGYKYSGAAMSYIEKGVAFSGYNRL